MSYRGLSEMDTDRTMIVGLGNPGERYEQTRHNVGFWCVDRLAEEWRADRERRRFRALVQEASMGAYRLVLVKPQTYMNDSGDAVGPAARWFKVPPDRLLVIHDDLDLPVGRVRFRQGGSSGGHRGVASIMEHLGSESFLRLRVGIGRPPSDEAVDYVLSRFSREEQAAVDRILDATLAMVRCVLEEGISEAMNRYNGLDAAADDDR